MVGARDGKGSPTINDVAAAARVSRQTVSNVLNAPDRVREETRERVRRAIDELGYRPHHFARNLKIQAANVLGYCVPAATRTSINPVMDRFLHALSAAARRHGYHVLLFTADRDDELSTYGELIASRAVDGFVVSETNYDDPRVHYLLDRGVPFGAFGRIDVGNDPSVPFDWVDVDGAHGTATVVAHLLARGHTRIAYVGWPDGSITGDERHRGYCEPLGHAGITVDPLLDVRGPDGTDTGATACARLLDLHDPPTAVVAASDLLAIGVHAAARDRGLDVGRGFAVAGFDDTPVAPFLAPALTSLRQPLEDSATAVVDALIRRLAEPDRPPVHRLLPPELIVRHST